MQILDPNSVEAHRYRVRMLSKEVCEQQNPQTRANIAQQLANAAGELAHLASLEATKLNA